jgi:hypothetical protein
MLRETMRSRADTARAGFDDDQSGCAGFGSERPSLVLVTKRTLIRMSIFANRTGSFQ